MRACSLVVVTALLWLWAYPALAGKTYSPKQEANAGAEAAQEILAQTPEWVNEEQRARCQAIVDAIVPYSARTDVKYTVRLLDTDEVNAFSLPGGTIFVTRGLLLPSADPDLTQLVAQSDHELAGILGHEMAHNCHFDGLRAAERSAGLTKAGVAAALLTLLIGGGVAGAAGVLSAGMNFGRGIMSHYSVEYESEADEAAIGYLVKTPYNPNGLLTFIERLAARERSGVQQELGILQTHPYSSERVTAIKRLLTSNGVEINRRAVTNWSPAEPLDALVHGRPAAVVILWDLTIYTFFDTGTEGETPADRAKKATEVLNRALSQGMAQFDVRVEPSEGGPQVTVMGEPMLTVLPGDVEAPGTPDQAAAEAARQLRAAMFGDVIGRTFKTGNGN
jgi:Zn-dependent protease with chaperone function